MKNLTTLIFAVFAAAAMIGQEVYLETGRNPTKFEVNHSEGDLNDTFQSKSNDFFCIGARYHYKEAFSFTGGVSYVGMGSIGTDVDGQNYVDYSLDYFFINVGGEYQVFDYKEASVYVKANAGFGIMMNGTQVLNNTVYSLPGNNDFGSALYSINVGVKGALALNEKADVYMQCLGGFSDPIGVIGDVGSLRVLNACINLGFTVDLIIE